MSHGASNSSTLASLESTSSEIHHACSLSIETNKGKPQGKHLMQNSGEESMPVCQEESKMGWSWRPTKTENRYENSAGSDTEADLLDRDHSQSHTLNESEVASSVELELQLAENGSPVKEEHDVADEMYAPNSLPESAIIEYPGLVVHVQ